MGRLDPPEVVSEQVFDEPGRHVSEGDRFDEDQHFVHTPGEGMEQMVPKPFVFDDGLFERVAGQHDDPALPFGDDLGRVATAGHQGDPRQGAEPSRRDMTEHDLVSIRSDPLQANESRFDQVVVSARIAFVEQDLAALEDAAPSLGEGPAPSRGVDPGQLGMAFDP